MLHTLSLTPLDEVWLLVTGCLVFTMQAGFLCVEAGLSRAKGSLEVEVQQRARELTQAKSQLEAQVQQRTAELLQAKGQLEAQVQQRTAELHAANNTLEEKVKQLELLNRVMMGREERILELKEEVKGLRAHVTNHPLQEGQTP